MKLEQRTRGAFLVAVLFWIVSCFFLFSTPLRAQLVPLYTVKTTSDTVVAGACVSGAAGCSLRGAIEAANAGSDSVIAFAIPLSDPLCSAGTRFCKIELTQALPPITKKVRINGPGPDRLWVSRSTGGEYRIFTVIASDTVDISGLYISNGRSASGGGIFHTGGILNVTNCWVARNSAINASGGRGGGISNFGGTVNVINSTINQNTSEGDSSTGGGVHNEAILNITNSTISDNTSRNGVFTSGGGIKNNNGTVNVTNTTISRNTAVGSNGHSGGVVNTGGTVIVKSSIIALNTATTTSGADVNGNFVSVGFNLIGKRDGGTGFTAPTDQTGTIATPLNPRLNPVGLRENGGPVPTIALLVGSPAIDKGSSFGLTGSLATDGRGAGYRRTFDSSAIPNAPGGDGTDIGAFELQTKPPFDFDGDLKTDIGIFRPSVAEWWISRSSNASVLATQFGNSADRITPGDFTGDGKTDIAFWRPSTGFWFVLRSEDFSFFAFPYGTSGDIPVSADYDADAKADAAVFRPSIGTWFIRRSYDGETTAIAFGQNGDQPVPADYDGDGGADVAIFRPGGGEWWIRTSAIILATQFGNSADKPVSGDYTGDGKADIAIWRPSTGDWFVLRSEDFSFFGFPFGTNGDIPAPGDYDGDGRHDATVFRPSNGTWYSQRTTAGILFQQFGSNGDRPIPNAFVP